MLLYRHTDDKAFCLCPYCGKLIKPSSKGCARDHIVPKALWDKFKTTTRFKEYMCGYMPHPLPEENSRNLIYCCQSCNRRKSDALYIPDWVKGGKFERWSPIDLKEHALYFYKWVDLFIEHYARQKSIYRYDRSYVIYCTNVLDSLREFKVQYNARLSEDHWDIDAVLTG